MIYQSIDDMPVYNWFKCTETGDFSWCSTSKKEDVNKCTAAFNKMYMQYIDKYGVNQDLQQILNLKNDILIHKIDMALTGDRTIKTMIAIKELDLKKLTQDDKKTNINTSKVAIEKYLGIRINTKEVTVSEYYDYLEVIKLENGRG